MNSEQNNHVLCVISSRNIDQKPARIGILKTAEKTMHNQDGGGIDAICGKCVRFGEVQMYYYTVEQEPIGYNKTDDSDDTDVEDYNEGRKKINVCPLVELPPLHAVAILKKDSDVKKILMNTTTSPLQLCRAALQAKTQRFTAGEVEECKIDGNALKRALKKKDNNVYPRCIDIYFQHKMFTIFAFLSFFAILFLATYFARAEK